MTVVVTNDDGIDSPGIHALAAMVRSLERDCVVVAPSHDMSGSSAAIGRIEVDVPTKVREVRLPPPATGIRAYAVEGPPGLAALLSARRGIDDVKPQFLLSGINAGTNTGHSILHSGTVGAAFTAASFGLSGLAVSLQTGDPMRWELVREPLAEAIELLLAAPRATVLNLNVPAHPSAHADGLRWASLDRFGSFRVAVAERRDTLVQLEYRATGAELEPESDTALVESGYATITAIDAVRVVPPEEIPFKEPRPTPEPRLVPAPSGRAAQDD
jgi:5'-nucleotidase